MALRKRVAARVLTIVCALGVSAQVTLQTSSGSVTVPRDKFHVYIVLGHSNCLGGAPCSGSDWTIDTVPHPRCWNLQLGHVDSLPYPRIEMGWRPKWGEWVPARCPIHYQLHSGFWMSNPALPMLKELVKHYPDDHYFGVIAAPETECWLFRQQKDYEDSARISRYDHAPLNVYHEWLQVAAPLVGRATFRGAYIDCITDKEMSVRDMARLVDSIRTDLQAPDMPVVWTDVPVNGTDGWAPTAPVQITNAANLDSLMNVRQNVMIMQTGGIEGAGKQHYCAAGEDTAGVRTARLFVAASTATVTPRRASPVRPHIPDRALKGGTFFDMRGVAVTRTSRTGAGVYLCAPDSRGGATATRRIMPGLWSAREELDRR